MTTKKQPTETNPKEDVRQLRVCLRKIEFEIRGMMEKTMETLKETYDETAAQALRDQYIYLYAARSEVLNARREIEKI